MKRPPKLQKGDTVAIVATARNVSRKAVEPGIKLLEHWGLNWRIGKSISLKDHQFAGPDQERASDLQSQFDDPHIKAVWCARGGYGTVRILDLLDFSSFKRSPKWVIGYSDITALHAHLDILGIASLHAEMAALIGDKSPQTAEYLRKILFGEDLHYTWNKNQLNHYGKVTGRIVGGNLSVLYSLLGSRSSLNPAGKILFLEELDEYLYHIDRMMQNLKRNGWFDEISGLLVGGMSDMNDNTVAFGKTAEEIIRETVEPYDFPVGFGFPAGHIKNNYPLILGDVVTLRLEDSGSDLEMNPKKYLG